MHRVREEDLAQIAVAEYANARNNPYAQMRNVQITLEQAMKIEGINRYIVDGLPMKTYDCSQITDGYASLILATDEGLQKLGVNRADCVEIAGYAQATDPLKKAGRDVLRPEGAYRAMNKAYDMAGVKPKDVSVAEIHDCFTVMAAIGTEVLGKAAVGQGAKYWCEGKAGVDGESPSILPADSLPKGIPSAPPASLCWGGARGNSRAIRRAAGEESASGSDVQHRRAHLRLRLHGAAACCVSTAAD